MTTSIGGVSLDIDMVWANEFYDPRVNASVEPTLGGGAVIQEFAKSEKGRAITLTSDLGQGLQTKAVVENLKALSDIAGGTHTLSITHNSLTVTKTVRFRNEVDGGAVQFDMISPMDGLQPATFYYSGTIFLMVVD